jgi:hypothetical protein
MADCVSVASKEGWSGAERWQRRRRDSIGKDGQAAARFLPGVDETVLVGDGEQREERRKEENVVERNGRSNSK